MPHRLFAQINYSSSATGPYNVIQTTIMALGNNLMAFLLFYEFLKYISLQCLCKIELEIVFEFKLIFASSN